MSITPQQLVDREVYACASWLISTLAAGYGAAIEHVDAHGRRSTNGSDLATLLEQAFELCATIPDYEEAARYEGWTLLRVEGDRAMVFRHTDGRENFNVTWGELCDEQGIEPYDREVFEHWIISDWLADKLEAHGEKVDRGFANLTIWARTTTGQAISSDYVIEQICANLNKPESV